MRKLDWPERMAEAIEAARTKPFTDTYYCATFAADVVQAITGIDYISSVRDLNQQDAEIAVCDEFGSIEAYLSHCFGKAVHTARALRGDVVIKEDETGFAIGICLGSESAFTAEDGLAFFKTLDCKAAYNVI